MNDIIELIIILIIAVTSLTIVYRLFPFKVWVNQKPKLAFFPKYMAQFEKSVSEIELALEKIHFKKIVNGKYSRGKIYGDFSAKAIKLSVDIDEEKKQLKVYASFFGVLFDTGDIWKVTSDIVNS